MFFKKTGNFKFFWLKKFQLFLTPEQTKQFEAVLDKMYVKENGQNQGLSNTSNAANNAPEQFSVAVGRTEITTFQATSPAKHTPRWACGLVHLVWGVVTLCAGVLAARLSFFRTPRKENVSENIVKCRCQHCSGNIAFDASNFKIGETKNVECPHCHLDTIIFVPRSPTGEEKKKIELPKPEPQQVIVEIKKGASPLGIASLIMGVIACLFCWIPYFGLVSIPIGTIGFLLAVIGITVSCVSKKTSFVFSISGGIVCLLSIFIAVIITEGIIAIPAFIKARAEAEQMNGKANDDEWNKSDTIKYGDMKIKITAAFIAPVVLDSETTLGGDSTSEKYLHINVSLLNLSNVKKAEFTTWRGAKLSMERDYANLIDDNGNVYERINFGILQSIRGTTETSSIYPNQSCDDTMIFQLPVGKLKWLHLELPAENFGGTGMIKFEIPKRKIE